MAEYIDIRGARTHNLKGIDLKLPRDSLVVITGPSGSGKSSLAFDTLFAEGQRRYVESLSAYARQFLSVMDKPEVDLIEGLSPAISIEQKTTSHNPRSTVGTITEVYDYLRLLFARTGEPMCPLHGEKLRAQTISQMVDAVMAMPEGKAIMLLAPVVNARKGNHQQLLTSLASQGYLRARIDGEVVELDEAPDLDARRKHSIDVVVDRIKIRAGIEQRLAESLETATALGEGTAIACPLKTAKARANQDTVFSTRFACTQCGYSVAELEPRSFSFNSPHGACERCDGLGVEQFFDPELLVVDQSLSLADGAIRGWDRRTTYYFQMIQCLAKHYGFDVETPYETLADSARNVILYGSGDDVIAFEYQSEKSGQSRSSRHTFEGIIPNLQRRFRETSSQSVRDDLSRLMSVSGCTACDGMRLNETARHVMVGDHTLPEITSLAIAQTATLIRTLKLPGQRGLVAKQILHEIDQRLSFLVNVGLDYLSLDRSADTLSGGEAQRIRLASQIGAGLMGVMYVLDEPSIGLHQRDNAKLLQTLNYLRDLGNTIIVVEHDEDAIRAADYIVDIGPGAGVHGGQIVAEGSLDKVLKSKKSLTGQYLSGKREIPVPERQSGSGENVVIKNAAGNNLKKISATIPVGTFTCITGVSGSGKSTLINHTLYRYVMRYLHASKESVAPVEEITGLDAFDKVVEIDQSPIGRTPRSNPATYSGLFAHIRELFAGTQEARSRGYKSGRFSFNVKGGRCEACQGDGLIKVEMHFLPDVYVPCDVCKGKRYNRETLDVRYKGMSIHEVLEMTVEAAGEFFSAVPSIARKLDTLNSVGLSYITLGQNATTLSGGEAQRIKLSRELSKRATGKTLYILDEPTTGLHFDDVRQLLGVLHTLRDQGNTIIVIEHNLDVIKTADWIIDMGPEGGHGGGEVVASGTPETIAATKRSHTGKYLKTLLGRTTNTKRKTRKKPAQIDTAK